MGIIDVIYGVIGGIIVLLVVLCVISFLIYVLYSLLRPVFWPNRGSCDCESKCESESVTPDKRFKVGYRRW
jgi:hypothetical protein